MKKQSKKKQLNNQLKKTWNSQTRLTSFASKKKSMKLMKLSKNHHKKQMK